MAVLVERIGGDEPARPPQCSEQVPALQEGIGQCGEERHVKVDSPSRQPHAQSL
ncbi:MAG TPA: hypothetical protein VMB27_08370 [Solirubrobacteraceae bacterium]|nr:hypothetical protein [Solirubrobacteraceae bacterium]